MKVWCILFALVLTTTTSAFCPARPTTVLATSSTADTSAAASTAATTNKTKNNRKSASRLHDMMGSILDLLSGGEAAMVSPENALPGRKEKMPNISGLKHYVLGNDLETVPEGHKVAVFANGCLYVPKRNCGFASPILSILLCLT